MENFDGDYGKKLSEVLANVQKWKEGFSPKIASISGHSGKKNGPKMGTKDEWNSNISMETVQMNGSLTSEDLSECTSDFHQGGLLLGEWVFHYATQIQKNDGGMELPPVQVVQCPTDDEA
ncbi:hypothetical protein QAD02_021072 [Eretmocerus hayati]|uniref:Uncharacterized protein n=1 Tax=Eretmocerus hayati TaxID=131215 RepID=A0ACC2PRQ1_9HYME|nr:hypothetical protein QAD02_021072 [Eretmocerus hayati]